MFFCDEPVRLSDYKVVHNIASSLSYFSISHGFSRFFHISSPTRAHGIIVKVTVDLQGCLPKNHSHARVLCYNHKKVYIIVKVIKCRIIGNNFFWDFI